MKLSEVLATSNSDHTNILCKQLLTLVNSYHINGAEYVAIKACTRMKLAILSYFLVTNLTVVLQQ